MRGFVLALGHLETTIPTADSDRSGEIIRWYNMNQSGGGGGIMDVYEP